MDPPQQKPISRSAAQSKLLSYDRNLKDTWTIFCDGELLHNPKWKGSSDTFLVAVYKSFIILFLLLTGKALVDFLMAEGILPSERLCHKCNQPMRLWQNTNYSVGCQWVCRRKNKKNKRECPATASVRAHTIFSFSKLSLSEIVMLGYSTLLF